MRRKLITLKIYADDRDLDDVEDCINNLLSGVNSHYYVVDETLELKVKENHLELYKQLQKLKLKEVE